MGRYEFGSSGPRYAGIPLIGGFPVGLTKVFFVDYGNGSDSHSEKTNSVDRPWKTISKAYTALTTNKNEGVALMGSSTHALTGMLTTAKNRIHMFGYDPGGRSYGQNAKVSLGVTTAAADIGTILNTGVRNSFKNVKFMNSNTVAQGIYCFVEGGEYAVIDSCEIYKETDLNETTASEMVMNGDSAQVYNCVIGSSANLLVGDIIRANVRITAGIAGAGKVARDVSFYGCKLLKKAAGTASCYFYAANATDVERMFHIKDSLFYNSKLASGDPAQCVIAASAQTEGDILIDNCTSINNTKLSTSTGVAIAGPVPTYATTGIAVVA